MNFRIYFFEKFKSEYFLFDIRFKQYLNIILFYSLREYWMLKENNSNNNKTNKKEREREKKKSNKSNYFLN